MKQLLCIYVKLEYNWIVQGASPIVASFEYDSR